MAYSYKNGKEKWLLLICEGIDLLLIIRVVKNIKIVFFGQVIKKELVTDDEDIDWVQTEKHVFETASNHPFLVGLHSCFQVTANRNNLPTR